MKLNKFSGTKMGPRLQWSNDHMAKAIADVSSGLSIRKAAEKWKVPGTTLQDRISGRVDHGSKPGPPRLNHGDERKLVDYAINRAAQGVGFSKKSFFKYAGDLARKRGRTFKRSAPSDKWWRLMKRRHTDFSLRSPEATAAIRHKCMNRVKVAKYFAALREVLDKNPSLASSPECIWNLDEAGLSLVHDPGKVIAR